MTRWYREKKQEHFYKEAKRVGYRARSAFKLQQIQERFHILSKDDYVVDLGAAPGGWSQVAEEIVGPQGRVVGVDIHPVEPLDNVEFILGDIADSGTMDLIQKALGAGKADVVLSDMSPDISGSYTVDQARSLWLCNHALGVAEGVLKPGGNFLCKIFEGEDTKSFIENVRSRFYIVKKLSPRASRKRTSEVYIIGKSYKNK